MRRTPAALVIAALALLLAATAFAASGVRSGTYRGALAPPRNTITITLKLRGTRLGPIRLSNIPLYCAGGGTALLFSFPATRISRTGTFTTAGNNTIKVGPLKGQVGERLRLTGRFTKRGTVSGTLKTTYPNAPACGGSSGFRAHL